MLCLDDERPAALRGVALRRQRCGKDIMKAKTKRKEQGATGNEIVSSSGDSWLFHGDPVNSRSVWTLQSPWRNKVDSGVGVRGVQAERCLTGDRSVHGRDRSPHAEP